MWLTERDADDPARLDSLYDQFGEGFTLLALGPDDVDRQGLAAECSAQAAGLRLAAEQAGIPLHLLVLNHSRLCSLYGARFVLIRPDQHVAWRGEHLPQDIVGAMNEIWSRVVFK